MKMLFTQKLRARFVRRMIRLHIPHDTREILDIGCGNGIVSRRIQDGIGVPVIGTDLTDYRDDRVEFMPMTHTKYGYYIQPHPSREKYDVGTMVDVFHHLTYLEQPMILDEALRHCRWLIIVEPVVNRVLVLVDVLANVVHNPGMPITLTFRTLDGWLELFGAKSFRGLYRTPFWWPVNYHVFVLESSDDE